MGAGGARARRERAAGERDSQGAGALSGIAGVFRLDGRPAAAEPLGAMMKRLAHRGPDGAGTWTEGPVALGFLALHTTPESSRERQPLVSGRAAIVFHGRLDNRDELAAALDAARDATDAELALAACGKWGEDAPGRFLGDFAFAFWDGARLLGARDWIGARPFAYAAAGKRLLFASEPGALFGDPELPRDPNEGTAAELLAGAPTHREETLWRGVKRLPPSHLIWADASGVRTKRYEPRPAEAAGGFREIFRDAVRARLRSPSPVAIDLSGGLDSSAIVGMAAELGAPFETFSEEFPGLACDERRWIDEVVAKWGLKANILRGGLPGAAVFSEAAARSLDFPGYPNSAVAAPARAAARDRGFRVVLAGNGADEFLSGLSARSGLLRAVLPRPVFEAAARAAGRRRPPAWIATDLAERTGLVERMRAADLLRSPAPGAEAARRFAYGASPFLQHMLETDERDAAWMGLELRWPYLDRRLVAFALAQPGERLRRGTATKLLLREGLRDLLPESVRGRRDKADFSHLFLEAFRLLGGARAFHGLRIAGWVNEAVLPGMLARVQEDESRGTLRQSRFLWPLWMICGLEIWYAPALAAMRSLP